MIAGAVSLLIINEYFRTMSHKCFLTGILALLNFTPFYSQCDPSETEITITIRSDEDAGGTSWELKDQDNKSYQKVSIGTYENGLTYTHKICVPFHKTMTFMIMFNGGSYKGLYKVESGCNTFVSGTEFLDFHRSDFTIVEPDQEVEFELVYGGFGNDWARIGEQTCDGGFVIAGRANRTGETSNIFLQKLNHYGDTLWTKYYFAEQSNYLGGLTKSPGENYIFLTTIDEQEQTNYTQNLTKVDYQGNILWSKEFIVDPKTRDFYGRLFATMEDHYVMIKYWQSTVSYVIHDGNGELVLNSSFSSGGFARFTADGIAQMEDGKLLILGIMSGYNPNTGTLFKHPLIYVIDDKKFVDYWDYEYSVSLVKAAFSLPGGELHMACWDTSGNTRILRANLEGEVMDEKIFPGRAENMIRTSDGGYILGMLPGPEANHSVILKLDRDLNSEWEKNVMMEGYDLDINSVRQTMDGGYFFTGSLRSLSTGLSDIYILKTNGEGSGCFYRPYGKEKICVVTVSLNSGKNMIVWEKTPGEGTAFYNIYREDKLIGTQAYEDLSIFVDTMVDPETRPFLYKISLIDSCGNESALSPYHKPLFLQWVSSDQGVNLQWSKYEIEGQGVDFTTYSIYRGSDAQALDVLSADIPTELDVFTDKDPRALEQKYYYRVAGILDQACEPSGNQKSGSGPYQQSMSNLEDNKLGKTGFADGYVYRDLMVYPNPVSDKATIRFNNPGGDSYLLLIRDISGKIQLQTGNITGEIIDLDPVRMEPGLYFIELLGPVIRRGRFVYQPF